MSIPITIAIANPDPDAAPTTFEELIVLLRDLITAEAPGTFIPYVQGSATPDVGDQDKVWHKTDGAGRPLGTFVYYGGAWRRQYIGNPNMVLIYRGDPSVDFAETGGRGTVGGEWDGWNLMNGENGTIDLSDKFIVAAHTTDLAIGYAGGQWATSVTGSTTHFGGVPTIQLDNDNTYRPARDAVQVARWEADGNTPNAGGSLYGLGSSLDLLAADAGNEAPDAIATLPPYLALAFVQFIGYA